MYCPKFNRFLPSVFFPYLRNLVGVMEVEALRYNSEDRGFDSLWGYCDFRWFNPSGRTTPLRSNHRLIEMSTRSIAVRMAENLDTLTGWLSGNSRRCNFLETSEPAHPCIGIAYMVDITVGSSCIPEWQSCSGCVSNICFQFSNP